MTKAEWDGYVTEELARAKPRIARLGFELDKAQPHLAGERYLMQAITSVSGPKLILIGTEKSGGKRVVIKATSHPSGAREIRAERRARVALNALRFSYGRFYAPEELLYAVANGMTIAVQEFIEQDSAFLERPLKEQFAIALHGLKTQEGAHATTYGHLKRVSRIFPIWGAHEYRTAAGRLGWEAGNLESALAFLKEHETTIEQYSGFLTHSDFVPHNIRMRAGVLYLLDHSSLRFGNKYEGWARFINFMVLYNPPLADALVAYVRLNRTPEELCALMLMRVFRLIEIIAYYTGTLERSEGSLRELNTARIAFWRSVLDAVINEQPPNPSVREAYIAKRETLRTPEEKERQRGLH